MTPRFWSAILALAVLPVADAAELPTPDSEYATAIRFLNSGRFGQDDINHIRFFTTYAVPEKYRVKDEVVPLRQECEAALSYTLNSVMGVNAEPRIVPPKRVPGSETLWYIDITDFGWSTKDIDAVAALQPYFLTPLVDGDNTAILFRADWFIVYATDTTKVVDRDIKDIPYYILLYGKGKEPKDADDFRKAWQVDLKTIRAKKVETGTIIDSGESGVSQHTRQLSFGRTIFGDYSQTKDVKTHDIDPDKVLSRDYIEDIFARQVDAGEYIASHQNGLQVYFLSNGSNQGFKRVDFADPTLVVDRQDARDPRVRTAKGCMVCHYMGYIPYTNAIKDLFRQGGDIRVYSKELQREIEAFYLGRGGEEIERNNSAFARAVLRCNGLTVEKNVKAYVDVYDWYCNKVSSVQAACECGQSLEDFKKTIRPTTTGRLTQLYHGTAIPRDVWDSVNAGGYVQARLLLKRIDNKPPPPPPVKQPAPPPTPPPPSPPPAAAEVIVEQAVVVDGAGAVVVYLGRGIKVRVIRAEGERYLVQSGQFTGYINKKEVR